MRSWRHVALRLFLHTSVAVKPGDIVTVFLGFDSAGVASSVSEALCGLSGTGASFDVAVAAADFAVVTVVIAEETTTADAEAGQPGSDKAVAEVAVSHGVDVRESVALER